MMRIQSLKVFQADGVPIHRLLVTTSCSSPIPVISWASYLPKNLVNLSLRNCNLSDDDFPRDVANLFSLQSLDLSGNPISRLPDCIRDLTDLQYLFLDSCKKLKSLLRLPTGLVELRMAWCTSLEKVTYQSCKHKLMRYSWSSMPIVEFLGRFKLEPIERVDKKMLKLLSLEKLESLENILMDTSLTPYDKTFVWNGMRHVQGLYEDGIFSTFLPGDQVPGQFSHRSRGSSISFTVPSLSNLNIRGLNIFSVVTKSNHNDSDLITNVVNIDGSVYLAITVVSNNSSGLKWVYGPTYFGVPREGKDVIWLSHWRFGNRLKGGDEMTILIYTKSDFKVKECGIQLVYYDDKDPEEITSTELIVAANLDDPCFLRAGVSPTIGFYPLDGITFQCDHTGIEGNIDLIRDINEKSEKKQGAEGDLILKHAAQSGSNSNSNKRGFFIGWKGIMMATVFLLSLPLVARSALFQHRKKQQSTSPP
ncbi:PREDICTED: uncharacterized protein LOC101313944 [Fragaria vesca subsp. vesca]